MRTGRKATELRPLSIEPAVAKFAAGSARIALGDTIVLCTASLSDGVPGWLRGSGRGWLTAEYSMLPGATPTRTAREAVRVGVAPGSMLYSAVSQPRPEPRSQRGTPSLSEAVHKTIVSPSAIRADPAANLATAGSMLRSRIWSAVRSVLKMILLGRRGGLVRLSSGRR